MYLMSIDRSTSDASRTSPVQKAKTISMSRTNSSPGNFDGAMDRPMRLAEIYVAAEHALEHTISNADLWKSLSSLEEFEVSKLTTYRHTSSLVPHARLSFFCC